MKPLTDDQVFFHEIHESLTNPFDPAPVPVPESDFYCTTKTCGLRGVLRQLTWRDCGNRECCKHGGTHYPVCEECRKVMVENVRPPGVIWTGTIGKRYRDPQKEGYHDPDGQWAWTCNTPDGKPKPVRLETWQDVSRFAKENGTLDPRELPNNMEVGESGKSVSWRGNKGQEI